MYDKTVLCAQEHGFIILHDKCMIMGDLKMSFVIKCLNLQSLK